MQRAAARHAFELSREDIVCLRPGQEHERRQISPSRPLAKEANRPHERATLRKSESDSSLRISSHASIQPDSSAVMVSAARPVNQVLSQHLQLDLHCCTACPARAAAASVFERGADGRNAEAASRGHVSDIDDRFQHGDVRFRREYVFLCIEHRPMIARTATNARSGPRSRVSSGHVEPPPHASGATPTRVAFPRERPPPHPRP